jgi:hypothetical protein
MKDINRINKIKEMIKDGLSYSAIGKAYGVSRQRIEQLIRPYKSDIKEHIGKSWKNRTKRDFTEITCQMCGKKKQSKYRYVTPMFCSKECSGKYRSQLMKNKYVKTL